MKSDEKVAVAGPEIGCWHNQTQAQKARKQDRESVTSLYEASLLMKD